LSSAYFYQQAIPISNLFFRFLSKGMPFDTKVVSIRKRFFSARRCQSSGFLVRRTRVRPRAPPRFPRQDEKYFVSELETTSGSYGVSGRPQITVGYENIRLKPAIYSSDAAIFLGAMASFSSISRAEISVCGFCFRCENEKIVLKQKRWLDTLLFLVKLSKSLNSTDALSAL